MESRARNHVSVKVEVIHSPHHSTPNRLFYIYFITIKNLGHNPVQILRRHWEISDATGELQTVDGEGVVGQTPMLEPDQEFIYNSGVPIIQAPGKMHGFYTARAIDPHNEGTDELFTVEIPTFVLPPPDGQTTQPPSATTPNRVIN